MYYYKLLALTRNKTDRLFTYRSAEKLAPGSLCSVSFRKSETLGIVVKQSDKFSKALAITATHRTTSIPLHLLSAALRLGSNSAIPCSGVAKLLLGSANPKRKLPDQPAAKDAKLGKIPKLTAAQDQVLKDITAAKKPTLLHGITGSGKTRIYIELTKQATARGSSAIVLSPEVGLSSQLQKTFQQTFGNKIITIHSKLTKKEREEAWLQVATSKEPVIVIGPRSALFSPVANLGLIVLDEFHDNSYKQTNDPRYHALHAASLLATAAKAKLVAGSATPNVTHYKQFKDSGYSIVELRQKAKKEAKKPTIKIVDMRGRKQKELLSKEALTQIRCSVDRQEQSLVFFNRRGSARLVVCDECGWEDQCQDCDYAMVLHKDTSKMMCHICTKTSKPKSLCADCGSGLSYKVPGIKQLEVELRRALPGRQIVRFDSDNAKAESLNQRLEPLTTEKGTVIIGTQLISKGLDLPLLSSVIAVKAEAGLSIPDYRADELTFQQLSQIIGRVGRGHVKETCVLLQTNNPESEVINLAAAENWHAFYETEIKRRQQAMLPPFQYLATVRVRRKTQKGVQTASDRIIQKMSAGFPAIRFAGPAPSFIEKRSGYYEWVIQAFAPRRSSLLELAATWSDKEQIELDPIMLF